MANKQIKDFTNKAIPQDTDKMLIQESTDVTKHILLGAIHQTKVGFFDYNDAATGGTPISHNGSEGYKKLTNDGAGAFTNLTYIPVGMTTLWNTTTNQFDFSELSLGDMIDLRVDIDVTTTAPNQEVVVRVTLAIGGVPYSLEVDRAVFKSAGTYKMLSYTGGYMGDANTLDNAGEVQLDTDDAATVTVQGWYCKVTRR